MKKRVIAFFISVIMLVSMFNMPASVFAVDVGITFPQISAQDLKSNLASVVANGHPFIIADKDNFDRVRENAFGSDPVITKQYQLIKDKATALLDEPLARVYNDITSGSYIGTAIKFWKNVMNLAFVWQIEGDERYAERAWEQTRIFCEMEHWGKYQMIDNVQTVFGVALCYDWLYDWLSDSQKSILINALNSKHFNMLSDLYENPDKDEYQETFYYHIFGGSNHTIMDNILSFLGAMAIAEHDMDYYTNIMQHALKNLETPFARWYPDSAWYEGLGYWSYTAPYMSKLFTTMKNSFGSCMGYENIPCLMNVSDFPVYAQSEVGSFVWNDTAPEVDMRIPVIYNFGVLKNDIGLQKFALENTPISTLADPEFCLMYDPTVDYSGDLSLQLDKFFGNTDLAIMRSSLSGGQEIWAAMAVQEARANTGMMNSGTVALDALGERWIMNHGKEEYYRGYWNFDSTRWDWYRTRAEANSCLVIDPSKDGGQNVDSKDVIDTFVSGDGGAYAISDLTTTYSGQVSAYKRGVSLLNGRRTFVVQDEFSIKQETFSFLTGGTKKDVYSFFNLYKADIELLPDGKSAIVSKGNKKLYVEVYSDQNFTLSVMDCEPLSTSPVPSQPNTPNPDFKKLAIFFSKIKSANIRVSFTPYLCEEELLSIKGAAFVPLSNWQVENSADVPKLSGISINGIAIDGFNPDKRYYEIVNNTGHGVVTASANSALYDVTVIYDADKALHKILVTDKNNSSNVNCYMVDLSSKTLTATPSVTYTNSSFKGVMMPQTFHRMQNGTELGVWYVKDNAPINTKCAVLTVYAKAVGTSVSATLNACNVLWQRDLGYLSLANTPLNPELDFNVELAPSAASVYGDNLVKIEYDITPLIPQDGGEFAIAFLPKYPDEDFIAVASHLHRDETVRPQIQYLYN